MTVEQRSRISLRAMEQFIAVAEELHFHRAARRLAMSQPPLTLAIRKLEQQLGASLLERGNRVLGLTAAGRVFLDEARATLAQARRAATAARDMAAGRTGLMRLGYVGSALYGRLPDVIQGFRQRHPAVRLELHEATTAAQVAGLRDGTLDLAVLIPPLTDADDLHLTPFDRDRLCLALPRDHPLANGEPELAAVAEQPFILWPREEGRGFHLQVIRLCADAGFVPRVAQEAHGMHAVLSLVAVGAGVSVVPASMAGFRADRIRYRPLPGDGVSFELNLASREPAPPAARFLREAG
ncbi:LysR family transcriptional regulator [Alloalcanivorax gelatiniphagus]|uniref:LysR family transcriptional regulator n=2 Tax=Alloalcanivorax gelatiniphagus TaxID=1194167 RepID=A0ABY2XPQ9_9GAMM|nr:LysR family transcriptional regulator [Alloalcanivorax gelatiniphagus]TMW14618.1 LysR family transcriptional regulator [Alloalcanivorax gelatiniphagus]